MAQVRTRGNFTVTYFAIATVFSLFIGVMVGGWLVGKEPLFDHPWGVEVFGATAACAMGVFWGLKTSLTRYAKGRFDRRQQHD